MADLDETRMAGLPARTRSSGGGWLSSSGSIDHGRFEPGAVVDGRYRIIGLLGRGGMGEVYRADDLRLGQPVAIKLLPDALAADPQRLVQFHNEVRTARQVSHPNVCRVYDIGDLITPASSSSSGDNLAHHQLFLTMEYVDGEDLSSLLRRIGRLPEDKALEIARQICAGLAAAHARGVIHRDLKPANIMLDSAGQVRLMDFGLAAIGAVADVRAGTPGYMAPEQLSGTGVSVQSDIWALGLVLYELFTGKRTFEARTLGELIEQHQSSAIVLPTALVTGLNPAIERVILRCLRPDPAARPASVLAVAAALPGGDPLAAALAAGETPSPQMVAAAGDESEGLSPRALVGWTVLAVAMLMATVVLSHRIGLHARMPIERAASTLFDRARDLEQQITPGVVVADRAWGQITRPDTLAWLRQHVPAEQLDAVLRTGRPPSSVFWYRSSGALLLPDGPRVSPDNPPARAAGDTLIVTDLAGRLLSYERMPDTLVAADQLPSTPSSVSWAELFNAAGIDPSTLTEAAPTYSPRAFADTRVAWIGSWPGTTGAELRVEAGAVRGRPVYFRTFGPWNLRDATAAAPSVRVFNVLSAVIGSAFLLFAVIVARANIRAGRGDRLGARRLATIAIAIAVVRWLLSAHHVPDLQLEQQRLFQAIGLALLDGIVLWLFYLAAEPYVRRIWPRMLITWSRLLGGHLRDRLVGRDLLVGAAAGLLMTVCSYVFHLVPGWMGWPPFADHDPQAMLGTRALLARFAEQSALALSNAMLGVLGLVLIRQVLGMLSPRLGTSLAALGVATVVFTPLAANGQFQSGILPVDILFGLSAVVIVLGVLFRYGLVAGVVAFATHFFTWRVAFTLDTSRPYFDTTLAGAAIIAGVVATGLVLLRSPRS